MTYNATVDTEYDEFYAKDQAYEEQVEQEIAKILADDEELMEVFTEDVMTTKVGVSLLRRISQSYNDGTLLDAGEALHDALEKAIQAEAERRVQIS